MIRKIATTSLLLISGNLPIAASGSSGCPAGASASPVTDHNTCSVSLKQCESLSDTEVTFQNGPATCSPTQGKITLTANVKFTSGDDTRYDVGMWVPSEDSGSDCPFKNTQCAVTVFPCDGSGDGDSCGDLLAKGSSGKKGTNLRSLLKSKMEKGSGDSSDSSDSGDGGKGGDLSDSGDDRGHVPAKESGGGKYGSNLRSVFWNKRKGNGESDDSGDGGESNDSGDGGESDDSGDGGESNDSGDGGESNDSGDGGESNDSGDGGDSGEGGEGGGNCSETFEFPIELPCKAGDDGYLSVPVCMSWDSDSSSYCSGPADAPTGNCGCNVISVKDVEVCKAEDEVCDDEFDTSCCGVCEETVLGSGSFICRDESSSHGDPHLVGFRGQKFDFTGQDRRHYALLAQDDPSLLLTMLLHAPVPDLQQITYIVGFGLRATDLDGRFHTIEAHVENPNNFYGHRKCPIEGEPCLAEGALTILLDGEVVTRPGTYELGPGFEVGAVNLPGQCRSFGFEKYWARKVREAKLAAAGTGAGRKLETGAIDMDEWILGDRLVTNRAECESYVTRAVQENTLFDFQSEYVSFQISTPELVVRVNSGKLHQIAMRDPTDSFDLPDHRTFQQNIAIERASLSAWPKGVLGETIHPTVDSNGNRIMYGPEAVRGEEDDYRVSGPFSDDFTMRSEGAPRVNAAMKAAESV